MANLGILYPGQPFLPNLSPPDLSAVRSRSLDNAKAAGKAGGAPTFARALAAAQKQVSFSRHALDRIESRQLDLSEGDLRKLDDTVEKMAQKGARESLIYLNDIALVVSVENRTVITAMDGLSAKENIFTNIDSAAIL